MQSEQTKEEKTIFMHDDYTIHFHVIICDMFSETEFQKKKQTNKWFVFVDNRTPSTNGTTRMERNRNFDFFICYFYASIILQNKNNFSGTWSIHNSQPVQY